MTKLTFGISITTDESTGEVLSVYFQIRKGKALETREFADGAAFADYNKTGELVGVELLAPCKVSVVDQLAENEPSHVRSRTKKFIRTAGPRQMVAA